MPKPIFTLAECVAAIAFQAGKYKHMKKGLNDYTIQEFIEECIAHAKHFEKSFGPEIKTRSQFINDIDEYAFEVATTCMPKYQSI